MFQHFALSPDALTCALLSFEGHAKVCASTPGQSSTFLGDRILRESSFKPLQIMIILYVLLLIYIYIYTHIYIYTYICIYIHIYIYVYMYMYIYIYIHTHTRTHTHIHIYLQQNVLRVAAAGRAATPRDGLEHLNKPN